MSADEAKPPAAAPEEPAAAAAAATQPPRRGASLGTWVFNLLAVAVIVVGFYAYIRGDLDPVIDFFSSAEPAPAEEAAATPAASAPAPAPAATPSQPAAAPAAPPAADGSTESALIAELEAAQRRILALERDTRSLLGIVEDLGSEVREGGGGGGTSPQQLLALRLELIDLRLRLDGDTFAASAALEQLGLLAGKGTQLGLLIDGNRLRLASITPRAQLLEMADGLIRQARAASDGAREAAAAYGSGAAADESLLGQLFTVRRSSPALEQARARHAELLAAATGLRTRLLLRDEQGYLEDLATVQRLLRELRAASAGAVELAAMAKAASDLAAAGYPAYRLQLEQQ